MNIDEIFQGLASLPRWVPYKMTFNPKREKFDKIPHNGRNGLATTDPNDWADLVSAITTTKENYGLSGVGFVMTSGIEFDGLTLIGFDFDDITPEWTPPFKTYAEKSPSKKGARMFAWVPSKWAAQYQDTLDCKPPNCEHAEIYIGSAPRFLTVTFDNINAEEIATLTGKDLLTIESWGMHVFEKPIPIPVPGPDVAGVAVDLDKFKLTKDQKHLVEGTGEIDRSNTVMGFLIHLIDNGVKQEDAYATMVKEPALWAYCLSHRNDNEDKALKFARQEVTRAYGQSLTGKREALIGFNQKWKVLEPVTKKADLKFPMEIYDHAPGLVGEIAHWILGASYVPREEYAYAAALSMVACLVGPYCTHGSGSRRGKLNLYLTLVGGTGTGKTEAISGMSLLLDETDAKDCILDFPASEAALRRQLTLTPNIILKVDELAHKLDGMKDNTNGSAMGRAILEAYDGARMPPKVYADSKNSLPAVENPFVQILGGTTDKVWEVVKMSHMEDGTLNRFIFVNLQEDPPYRFNPEPNGIVPKHLKDKLNVFWRKGRMDDLVGDVPGFNRHITYDDKVKEAIAALNLDSWNLQQEEFGSLYPRYVQNTMKIAAIITIGDGRDVVTIKDFVQAQKFMKWSITNTAKKVGAHMAGSNFERLEKRLIAKLEKEGGRLLMRDAYKFMHIYRREMDELTATLTLAGLVDIDVEESGVEWVILL